MKRPTQKSALILALAALIGSAALLDTQFDMGISPLIASAQAAKDGHSGGGHTSGGHSSGGSAGMPRGHSGSDSGGDEGHDHEESDDSGHSGGEKGGTKHGAHDGQGHGHDIATGGDRSVEERVFGGGRPVWAQEGIPEVELGRLNVARAPGHVLSRAEQEAVSEYTDAMSQLYNLGAEEAAALLQTNYRDVARIDSPLQNLAMYKDVMTFGKSQLPGVDNSQLDLAAIFLGSASDKTMPISEDTVIAINRILGLVDLSDQERVTLAGKAETVRSAILIGHGDVTH